MSPSDLAFYAIAASPIGGLLVAIPFALLTLLLYSVGREMLLSPRR